MLKQKLKWGIIGCGSVVRGKSGPAIISTGNSEIVAMMRRNAAELKGIAAALKLNNPLLTDNSDEVINNPEVDIVYIATPPSTHAQCCCAAANAGKHVLVEKPMAIAVAEAEAMIATAEQNGVELFVAYYRRFQPHIVKMQTLINSGAIGRVVSGQIDFSCKVNYNNLHDWRLDPAINGGGYFIDLTTHRIDAMNMLLGELQSSTGYAVKFDLECSTEQLVNLTVKYRNDSLCSVSSDFYAGRCADYFAIRGTAGSIIAEQLDAHKFMLQTEGKTEEFVFDKFSSPHLGLINHIEQVLLFNETKLISSGQTALATEIILDNIVRNKFN